MREVELKQIVGGSKETLIFNGICISSIVVSVIILPILFNVELKRERKRYNKAMSPEQERKFIDDWNYYCGSPGYNVLPRGTTPILLGWKEEKK